MSSLGVDQFVKNLVLSDSVLTCTEQTLVSEAILRMASRNVGCIIIVSGSKPVGIFTERDLLRKCFGDQPLNLATTTISKVMTPNPVSITDDFSIDRVLKAMRIGRFRHLVVVDQNGALKTVISVKDMIDWVVDSTN